MNWVGNFARRSYNFHSQFILSQTGPDLRILIRFGLHVRAWKYEYKHFASLSPRCQVNSHYTHLNNSLFHNALLQVSSRSLQMGLFHIATACLRHFLQLLLALLDEPSQGPLLGRFSPSAVEMVPVQNTMNHELEPSTTVLSSSASPRSNIAAGTAPPPNFKPQYDYVCREHTPIRNPKARPNGQQQQKQFKQESYILGDRMMRAMEEERMHHHHHHIEPSSSFALCQPPCDLPMLLNSELPPRSCTSMSVSSHSSMVSTPILPSWSPGTPITPTRQPRHKGSGSGGGGKLVGLGFQIMYDGDRSRQLDGLGFVSSRITEPDAAVEEEDLGVPSRILLEEIYNTFTTPEALEAAVPFPVTDEKDLGGDESSSVEDVFTARNVAAQGPSAVSTPRKKRSRLSYGLPTAASTRRTRRVCIVERDDGDESRSSSESSGGSSQRPAWKY